VLAELPVLKTGMIDEALVKAGKRERSEVKIGGEIGTFAIMNLSC